ncbi:MAG: hypothetical protein GX660_26335 [Clostridiaceae bacterium]|nr:hypothetical protein [Clostridiaceae bacterium]
MVAENKTLGQKILDVLRKLISKIEDILEVSGFTEGWLNTDQLSEAEKLWVNALSSVMETDQRTDSKADKKQSLKATDDDWMPANDGDHIQKRFGQDIYTLWVGEGNQIPFGDFDTKQEGENFFNKHRNRLMKFRNSSNIESDLEDSIPSERKMLGSMLENARYIEREYAKYERSKSKMTSINDVISNIKGNEYRRADLESLAEQVSHGNWDDYNDMTDDELSSALIENIESQAKELNVLERQDKRSGFSVRPIKDNARYSLKGIKEKYKEVTDYLEVYESKNKISLDNIEVKEVERNKGIGNNFMNELIEYADKKNKTIVLTPTTKYNSQKKLIDWYKTYGFVENKGKNTNFLYKDTMYREPVNNKDIKYSLKEMDKKYLEAVEKNDMETAQKMVIEYAESKGYTTDDDYRMMHEAPTNDGYNAPLHDITKIYPKDIFSSNGVRYYGDGESYDYESMRAIERAKDKPDKRIRVYRAVPKNIKDERVRVGDWITLSNGYAHLHGKSHINGSYKVIYHTTEAKNIWIDGNSINEFGFDDGKTYAYQNTKNNLKLLDPVTYDSDGKVIPLSKRFNKREYDVRFSIKDSENRTLTQEQAEYFKDSKVKDSKGNLLVMYHGTPKGGFTKVNPGTYFTQNKEYADNYQSPNASSISTKKGAENPETYEVYLNIKKPFDTRKAKERKIFNEDYYRKYGMGTPLVESGLPDWLDGMDLQEFIEEQGYDYDGLILDEGATGGYGDDVKSRGYSYVIFDSNQVKAIDNKNPSNNPDIRYQLRDMTLKDNTAKYTPERLENILGRYGSKSSPDYSKAYVSYISPDEFLSLTTTNLARIESESRELNLEDLQNETQEIFLKFDIDDKEVTGHEGRHRMVALREAGVKSVPVVLWQDGEKGKYNKLFLKSLKLTGEEFANNKAPGNVEIKNLIPASRAYEKTLTRDFVDAKGETTVRFQLRDNTSSKDVEKLQKTVIRLKEQFKLTKGVKLDEKSVRRLSKSILKDYGSKYSATEFETKLYSVYMGMVNGDMEYEDAHSIITEVAREVVENASVLNDAMYKQYSDLRNTMRNTAISISDRFKGDFDAVGGWNDFRKKNFGRINITNDGMGIDSLYQELSDLYPELFVKDIANPADQLMLISDVLDDFVPIYENPYNRDLNKSIEYLALEIFDGMTSIPEAKATFADKKKAEKQKAVEGEREKSKARIEAIKNKNVEDVEWLKYQNKEKLTEILNKEKTKRDNAVAEVKKKYQGEAYKTWWRNKLKENDIKSHYQEMIKDLRANRDEKLENQKTKYKERISGIYEDRKIKQAKDRIRTMTKNLSKMLRNPTQKKHIPKALDKTVAELLAMLDFTTDRQNENTQ